MDVRRCVGKGVVAQRNDVRGRQDLLVAVDGGVVSTGAVSTGNVSGGNVSSGTVTIGRVSGTSGSVVGGAATNTGSSWQRLMSRLSARSLLSAA